jgi:hypothetical protein
LVFIFCLQIYFRGRPYHRASVPFVIVSGVAVRVPPHPLLKA